MKLLQQSVLPSCTCKVQLVAGAAGALLAQSTQGPGLSQNSECSAAQLQPKAPPPPPGFSIIKTALWYQHWLLSVCCTCTGSIPCRTHPMECLHSWNVWAGRDPKAQLSSAQASSHSPSAALTHHHPLPSPSSTFLWSKPMEKLLEVQAGCVPPAAFSKALSCPLSVTAPLCTRPNLGLLY